MIEIEKLNFDKMNGLIPAIILNDRTGKVLMLGFMTKEALEKTIDIKRVTFFSRTKNRLWTKGETSGNYLNLVSISPDCDYDSLIVKVIPVGPTCHTGAETCFEESNAENSIEFLAYLFNFIKKRKSELPKDSYTTNLFESGENRIIQKVGEEAIETVIAAKNNNRDEIINEVSDLFYHIFVLLASKNIELQDISANLQSRHKES